MTNKILSDKCETCGTELITNCLVCGAPLCCPKCCDKDSIIIKEARMGDYNLDEMREHAWGYIYAKRGIKSKTEIYKELRATWEEIQDMVINELFEKGQHE